MQKIIKNIKGSDFPPELQIKFNIKPKQILTIIVRDEDDNDYDMENVGNALIESFESIASHAEGKIKLTRARDILKHL
ncbi:MAG: hypothetical protein HQK65_21080 [Desulfamplus sp.]|nr:hypothetical protein [Desulfamplus sp.]